MKAARAVRAFGEKRNARLLSDAFRRRTDPLRPENAPSPWLMAPMNATRCPRSCPSDSIDEVAAAWDACANPGTAPVLPNGLERQPSGTNRIQPAATTRLSLTIFSLLSRPRARSGRGPDRLAASQHLRGARARRTARLARGRALLPEEPFARRVRLRPRLGRGL